MAAAAAPPTAAGDARVAAIDAAIRVVPDFPKAGIMFHDVTTLLLEPAAFAASVDILAERYAGRQIDAVLGGWWSGGA
jgi:adenine phosphoribosyltransferase